MRIDDDDKKVEEVDQDLELLTPTGRSACPYLGLSFDKTTWFAFPSPGNCCHYVRNPAEIDMRHQQGFCLTANYPSCALLQLDSPKNLPRGIAGQLGGGNRRSKWWSALVVVAVLAALLIALLAIPATRARLLAGVPGLIAPTAAPPPPNGNAPNGAAPNGGDPNGGAGAVAVATETPPPVATTAPTETIPPSLTPVPTATQEVSPTPEPTLTATIVAPTSTPALPQALVTVELLNVRAGPGDDFDVIAQLEQQRQLSVTGRDPAGIWLRVCCLDDGGEGWVFALSVTVTGNLSTVPVVESE